MTTSAGPFPQRTRKIDTKLCNALSFLPGLNPAVLALRNLKRGFEFGLPSGTSVAKRLGLKPMPMIMTMTHCGFIFYEGLKIPTGLVLTATSGGGADVRKVPYDECQDRPDGLAVATTACLFLLFQSMRRTKVRTLVLKKVIEEPSSPNDGNMVTGSHQLKAVVSLLYAN
jgi:hypothetical protein